MKRKIVIIYGNCQANFIAFLLGQSPTLAERFEFSVVINPPPPGPEGLVVPPQAGDAALFWEQYDERAAVAVRDELRSKIPPNCPVVVFPPLAGMAFWPFAWAPPANSPEPGFPWGRYPWGDRIGLEVAKLNLPADEVFEKYMQLSMKKMPDLRELARRDRVLAERRDSACDVQIYDFIQKRYLTQHLFWTWGHTSSNLMLELVWRLFEKSQHVLGEMTPQIERELQAAAERHPAIGVEQLPIHPEVVRRLKLRFCAPETRYNWFGQQWTFQEYMTRYITLDKSW